MIYNAMIACLWAPALWGDLPPAAQSTGSATKTTGGEEDPQSNRAGDEKAAGKKPLYVFARSFDDRMRKSPSGAGYSDNSDNYLLHTADSTSCAGLKRKGLTPSDQ